MTCIQVQKVLYHSTLPASQKLASQ